MLPLILHFFTSEISKSAYLDNNQASHYEGNKCEPYLDHVLEDFRVQ